MGIERSEKLGRPEGELKEINSQAGKDKKHNWALPLDPWVLCCLWPGDAHCGFPGIHLGLCCSWRGVERKGMNLLGEKVKRNARNPAL